MTPFNKLLEAVAHHGQSDGRIDLELSSIVPAGQQLVVEFVSISCEMPPDQPPTPAIVILNTVGGAIVQHYPVMHSQIKYTAGAVYTSADPMRFRLTPDLTLRVVVGRNSDSGTARAYFGISGYIE
jgi:hypothetical protein